MGQRRSSPGSSKRPYQVGEQIRQVLSQGLLDGSIKGDGLEAATMVTVTEAKVSSDLRHARVFVSVFPDDEKVAREVLKGLGKAAYQMKRLIADELKLRHTPDLAFGLDTSIAYGAHIEALVKEVNEEDAKLRQATSTGSDEG